MSDYHPSSPSGEATVAERRDPLLGTMFDNRFRIDFRLAAGGFGAIYRVFDTRDNREVALKVLHPNLTQDKNVAARFKREGAVMISLRDPHTLAAYELGKTADRTLYIVMELLRGETVFDRMRAQGPFPWQRMVDVARAICSSLAEAHARGIVHRDLKPPNIFLERRDGGDFVKVLDFGIAKILRGSDIDRTELTTAGFTVGTIEYMSPEQIQGEVCTPRSDIFSLGVLMYEMLVCERPFLQKDAVGMLSAMLGRPPARPSTRVALPLELDRIVMKCLAPVPMDRFKDIEGLALALDRLTDDDEGKTSTLRPGSDDEAPTWFDPRAAKRTPGPVPSPPPGAGTPAAAGAPQSIVPLQPLGLQPTMLQPMTLPPQMMPPSQMMPPQMMPPQMMPPQMMPPQMMPLQAQLTMPMPPPPQAPPQPQPMMQPQQPMMPPPLTQLPPMPPLHALPPQQPPPVQRAPTHAYDMSAAAEREIWVRRIALGFAILVCAIIGLVLAAR